MRERGGWLSGAVMECCVCYETREIQEMQQILPCLHVFCGSCVQLWKDTVKHLTAGSGEHPVTGSNKFIVMCLAVDCFSRIRKDGDGRLNIKKCDNEDCCRRLSFTSLEHLACLHDVCSMCFDEARMEQQPVCPVEGCGESLVESEEGDSCSGECGNQLVCGQFVITKCCESRFCFNCFEKIFGRKIVPNEEVRCPEPCLLMKEEQVAVDSEVAGQLTHCKVKKGCEGIAVSWFPSKNECEHPVCSNCLDQMIYECQQNGQLPHCPSEQCEALYSIESVLALRSLFPNHSCFFKTLALDDQECKVVFDESLMKVQIKRNFKASSRLLAVKVELTDDGAMGRVMFDKMSSLREFLQEMRRELKMTPVEKVYGYYIRHPKPDDENEEEAMKAGEDELIVNTKTLTKTIEEAGFTNGCTLVVDTRGYVRFNPQPS